MPARKLGKGWLNWNALAVSPGIDTFPSMWRLLAGLALLLFGADRFKNGFSISSESCDHDDDLPVVGDKRMSRKQVLLVEERVKENYTFVMDSYDLAKKEGQNVLQWLFGAIIGGLGLVGSLAKENYWWLAVGAFVSVCFAAHKAAKLIDALKSNEMQAPGNSATTFKGMVGEGISETRMRWREAMGTSDRAEANIKVVAKIAIGTDKARCGIAWIPAWFLGSSAVAGLFQLAYRYDLLGPFLDWSGL